jgi:hypothetical protein
MKKGKKKIATEANSTDFVSSMYVLGKEKKNKKPVRGKFRKRPRYILFVRIFILFLT